MKEPSSAARGLVLPAGRPVLMFGSPLHGRRTMNGELIWPGRPYPLGATPDGEGTNFAVYARHAERVDVCLFDPADPAREVRRAPLHERTGHVFHAYLPGIRPGALYGFRAHGAYEPDAGLRFNGAKLLVDPYARAIAGNRCASWMDGRFLQGTFTGTRTLNDARPDVSCAGAGGLSGLRSLSDSGIVALCDGSVRAVTNRLDVKAWKAICSRNGGEKTPEDF